MYFCGRDPFGTEGQRFEPLTRMETGTRLPMPVRGTPYPSDSTAELRAQH
jgi:hypothetical protein